MENITDYVSRNIEDLDVSVRTSEATNFTTIFFTSEQGPLNTNVFQTVVQKYVTLAVGYEIPEIPGYQVAVRLRERMRHFSGYSKINCIIYMAGYLDFLIVQNTLPVKLEERELLFPKYDLSTVFPEVQLGGHWRPKQCTPRKKIAVIVPYRDRERQLRIFLLHMHPFLQRQNLDYTIYVIEQYKGANFNRGLLLNAGFVEVSVRDKYDCYIFHDVDMLPEDDRIPYLCLPDSVLHLSVALSKKNYKLPYKNFLGGVISSTSDIYKRVNGYSNAYFGWGAEDDDFKFRLDLLGINITRYNETIMRFKNVKHESASESKVKDTLLRHWRKRWSHDGLNSLIYNILEVDRKHLYTWMLLNFTEEQVLRNLYKFLPKSFLFKNSGEEFYKREFGKYGKLGLPKLDAE